MAIISEAALHQQIGGAEVMRDQLNHLIEMADMDNVTLQVLLYGTSAHPGVNGSFTILAAGGLPVGHRSSPPPSARSNPHR